MSGFETMPANPVLLASARAEHTALESDAFEITRAEEHQLISLEHAADQLGFIGQKYFVESYRSLSVPVAFEADQTVSYVNFMGLTFEGDFVTYSKVVIGRIIGAHSVRALCMAFDNVTLLPYFDNLPDDHLLYVPVLAVNSINAQAA